MITESVMTVFTLAAGGLALGIFAGVLDTFISR